MAANTGTWAHFFLIALFGALAVVGVAGLTLLGSRLLRTRYPDLVRDYSRARSRLILFVGIAVLEIVAVIAWPNAGSRPYVVRGLLIVTIAAGAWFLTALVSITVARIRDKHPIQGDDDQDSRRLHTQLSLIRGFLNAAIWLVASGMAFFTIPGAEAIGTSILASAGLASVVAGIAAQSLLGNVFAGLQLAFNGSVRVDDMITAQAQTGRVEEISLTSVVLRLWDGRQQVFPTSFFTTTPFENWTRGSSELLGAIQFDLDWRVSPALMRSQVEKLARDNPLWDGKEASLIIEDAQGGQVKVRVTVSAANPSDLGELRNQVREGIVEWLVTQQPASLPVQRLLQEPDLGQQERAGAPDLPPEQTAE